MSPYLIGSFSNKRSTCVEAVSQGCWLYLCYKDFIKLREWNHYLWRRTSTGESFFSDNLAFGDRMGWGGKLLCLIEEYGPPLTYRVRNHPCLETIIANHIWVNKGVIGRVNFASMGYCRLHYQNILWQFRWSTYHSVYFFHSIRERRQVWTGTALPK